MPKPPPRPFATDSNTLPRATQMLEPPAAFSKPPDFVERRQPENGGLRQAVEDVRRQLSSIEATLIVIEQRQYEHAEAIAALRVQSGIWGALAGLVAAVSALITTYMLGKP